MYKVAFGIVICAMLGWSQEPRLREKTALPSPRLDKGSVDGGIYKNPPIGLELTPDLKYERSSCRLARLLSGGEFLLSGDDTSSLLRLLLVFWRFVFGWFFLCRFLFSGWSGGFSLGFRSWLIRSRLVWSRGWFRRFRTIRGFRRFSSMLGRCGSGLGRSPGFRFCGSGLGRGLS
jgi:hypothetical protein